MKIFDKLEREYGYKFWFPNKLSAKRFSLLRRDELFKIVKFLRKTDLDDLEYNSLKDMTFRYNSQTTKELAANLYKWCKKYL